jgi:hypothetical protein
MARRSRTKTRAVTTTTSSSSAALTAVAGNQRLTPSDQAKIASLYDCRFACHCNAAYHGMRASFYELAHRSLMGCVIILGSGTIATLAIQDYPVAQKGLAFLMVALSTLDLVWGPSLKAQLHAHFRSRYLEMLGEIEEESHTSKNIKKWVGCIYRIYGQEPPKEYKSVQALAYNVATDALNEESVAKFKRLAVPYWHRLTANFCSRYSTTYAQFGKRRKKGWLAYLNHPHRGRDRRASRLSSGRSSR